MQKHVRIVGTICVVVGGFYLLALVFLTVFGMMAAHNDMGQHPLLPAAMAVAPFYFMLALLGVLHIAAGRAFRLGRGWARTVMWVLALINLVDLPVGTAFGVYAIWVLSRTRTT